MKIALLGLLLTACSPVGFVATAPEAEAATSFVWYTDVADEGFIAQGPGDLEPGGFLPQTLRVYAPPAELATLSVTKNFSVGDPGKVAVVVSPVQTDAGGTFRDVMTKITGYSSPCTIRGNLTVTTSTGYRVPDFRYC